MRQTISHMRSTDAADDPPVFDLIHARILRFFPDLVAELGGDPVRWMGFSGVSTADAGVAPGGATYRQLVNLIERAAAELDCPDFGMRLAVRQKGGDVFGPLGVAMRNSRTFGEALDYVSRHGYAHSLAARIWQRRSVEDQSLFVGHDILLDRMPNKSQTMEQILLLGHLAAMEMTGGHAKARKVHFRHEPISPPTLYRRYFGCEVRFGQNEDGLVFSARDLACPMLDPDTQTYQSVTAYIDTQFTRHRPPLHAEVRGLIMRFLGAGDSMNDRIAAELNLHPRTLHRRLRAEGTSFQRVKDEVRRDVMLYYLQQTPLDFAQISERLGFAEQSVMTRSCNRWFAASPTRIRMLGPGSVTKP